MLDTWGLPILKQEFRKRGFGLKLETCQFESMRFGLQRFVLDPWGLPIGVHEYMKAKSLGSNLRPANLGAGVLEGNFCGIPKNVGKQLFALET